MLNKCALLSFVARPRPVHLPFLLKRLLLVLELKKSLNIDREVGKDEWVLFQTSKLNQASSIRLKVNLETQVDCSFLVLKISFLAKQFNGIII
jgi:hypothetical protein